MRELRPARAILYIFGWLWGPFAVAVVLPRMGLRPPGWVMSVNAWLLASSPLEFLHELARARGVAIARRCGRADVLLQLAFGLACLTGAILQLRSAYRGRVGGESRNADRGSSCSHVDPGRRSATTRSSGESGSPGGRKDSMRWFGLLINLMLAMMIAYPTYYYAGPALAELRHRGYLAGPTGPERPEFNIFVRFFFTAAAVARRTRPGSISTSSCDTSRSRGVFRRDLRRRRRGRGDRGRAWQGDLGQPAGDPASALDILGRRLWPRSGSRGRPRGGDRPLGPGPRGRGHPSPRLRPLPDVARRDDVVPHRLGNPLRDRGIRPGTGCEPRHDRTVLIRLGRLAFLAAREVQLGALRRGFSSVIWLSQLSYRDARNAIHLAAYPHLHWIGLDTGEGVSRRSSPACRDPRPGLGGLVCWRIPWPISIVWSAGPGEERLAGWSTLGSDGLSERAMRP